VSRDYSRTQAWARRIHDEGEWAGARWWSYYEPQWASMGLWDIGGLVMEDIRPLRLHDAALIEASRTIIRRIITV